MDRHEQMINGQKAFERTTKDWGDQLTTSRAGAIVGVLRVLHAAHDKRKRKRKAKEYLNGSPTPTFLIGENCVDAISRSLKEQLARGEQFTECPG